MSSTTNAEALKAVLHSLSGALVYTEDTNIDTNRKLWNQYAKQWTPNTTEHKSNHHTETTSWLTNMAADVGRERTQLTLIGDEWSDPSSLDGVIHDWILPCIRACKRANYMIQHPDAKEQEITEEAITATPMTAVEIGVGGGRIASRTFRHVSTLHACDISSEMLRCAETSLTSLGARNVTYHLLKSCDFPPVIQNRCDLVYSFDVFPHIDLHTQWQYFLSIRTLLRSNHSLILLHVANLEAPLGWARFVKQSKYTAGGFYFMTPSTIDTLAAHANYRLLLSSRVQADHTAKDANLYYNRDYLFVMTPQPEDNTTVNVASTTIPAHHLLQHARQCADIRVHEHSS